MKASKLTKNFMSMLLAIGLISSCSNNVSPVNGNGQTSTEWLIPTGEIRDGGPGKDGIPSIDEPIFVDATQVTYLTDDDLVVGFKAGNEVRAYPHIILDWHEIVNDEVNGANVAITYCPLTGTAIGWNRFLEGQVTTFGVSGLLYNTNLIPYDRATDSNWSQMGLQCVNGELMGDEIELFHVVETTWGTWKAMYPQTKVMSTNTGFNRNYGSYPYGDYKTNNSRMLFSVNPDDNRLPRKTRVLGVIINEGAKVYPIDIFGTENTVINDEFNGEPIVVVGNRNLNFAVVFSRRLADGTVLEFEAVDNQNGVVLRDGEGTTYDVFGTAISGSRAGELLTPTKSYIGYWMAWGAFYPDPEISDYKEN